MEGFELVAGPAALADYCNSLVRWKCSEERLEDILPAISGQLVLLPQGCGSIGFGSGSVATPEAYFLAPLTQATPVRVDGPALMLGVSLNFRGWAALTGLSVEGLHDRILAVESVLPAPLAAEVLALPGKWRAGELDDDAALAALADIVARGVRPLRANHRRVIDATYAWLSSSFRPDLDDLYAAIPYSRRQAQRLIQRFFGAPPVHLIRRFRAIRAGTLLSLPDLDPAIEDEIREAYFDQAHLIREVRHFTGRTPRTLSPDKAPLTAEVLAPEGYSVMDPFAGRLAD